MTGLDILEEIKKEKINYLGRLPLITKLRIETIEKELKALEIIKEKKVNIGWFKAVLETKDDSYACYLFWVNYTAQPPLTEEEFNLLKEVLGE